MPVGAGWLFDLALVFFACLIGVSYLWRFQQDEPRQNISRWDLKMRKLNTQLSGPVQKLLFKIIPLSFCNVFFVFGWWTEIPLVWSLQQTSLHWQVAKWLYTVQCTISTVHPQIKKNKTFFMDYSKQIPGTKHIFAAANVGLWIKISQKTLSGENRCTMKLYLPVLFSTIVCVLKTGVIYSKCVCMEYTENVLTVLRSLFLLLLTDGKILSVWGLNE